MNIIKNPPSEDWPSLCTRPEIDDEFLESRVSSILNVVKSKGDEALKIFTKQFDQVQVEDLAVGKEEIDEAEACLRNFHRVYEKFIQSSGAAFFTSL